MQIATFSSNIPCLHKEYSRRLCRHTEMRKGHAIGRIVSSDIERLTQVRYNVVGYPSFLAQADGGYVDFSGSEPRYCWYTKDHLGSVSSVVGGMTKLAGETAKTATEGNTKPSGRALSIEQGVLKTEEVSDIHGMYYNPKF